MITRWLAFPFKLVLNRLARKSHKLGTRSAGVSLNGDYVGPCGWMAGTVLRNGPANEIRMSLPMRASERGFIVITFASHSHGPLGEAVPAHAKTCLEQPAQGILHSTVSLCGRLIVSTPSWPSAETATFSGREPLRATTILNGSPPTTIALPTKR